MWTRRLGTVPVSEGGVAIRGAPATTLALDVDPRSVRQARVLVREVLSAAGLEDQLDTATLAVSEVVTNAIVHAGTLVELRVYVGERAVRVEVEDRGMQLPSRRTYSDAAGTGRGLAMVEDTVDRWGVEELGDGKVVWFEVGGADELGEVAGTGTADHHEPRAQDVVHVRLRHVPLLMHVAWQEHAAALLREFLLHSFGSGHDILAEHAQASEAMSLLHAQLPVPELGAEPQALMAAAIEPHVSVDSAVLEVPLATVAHFATLDQLLNRGIDEARAGHFLCPPTQPEIEEMRRWLCAEVARQAAGDPTAIPWVARSEVSFDLAGPPSVFAGLADTDEPLVATDENSVVVAVSAAALRLLGYDGVDDLVGKRVLAVVPERFRQAHVAGVTLNATNGRDVLLDVPVQVPMVRVDGSEVDVELTVTTQSFDHGRRAFVARFRPV